MRQTYFYPSGAPDGGSRERRPRRKAEQPRRNGMDIHVRRHFLSGMRYGKGTEATSWKQEAR